MKTEMKKEEQGFSQAKAQLECILEMVKLLEFSKNEKTMEDARQTVSESPLSVQVRSGWCNSKSEMTPEEFEILLCTGGPAVRLVGTLGKYVDPESVTIEYQDWFTPWTEYRIDTETEQKLLRYCREFYFGE